MKRTKRSDTYLNEYFQCRCPKELIRDPDHRWGVHCVPIDCNTDPRGIILTAKYRIKCYEKVIKKYEENIEKYKKEIYALKKMINRYEKK